MTGLVVRGRAGYHAEAWRHLRGSSRARLRTWAAAAVVLTCCVAGVSAAAFGRLGGEFGSIGQRNAPEVDVTTGLYFSLNDMDAQVANVLLTSGDVTPGLARDRAADTAAYGSDRAAAGQDLRQAIAMEAGDAAAERELGAVLQRGRRGGRRGRQRVERRVPRVPGGGCGAPGDAHARRRPAAAGGVPVSQLAG